MLTSKLQTVRCLIFTALILVPGNIQAQEKTPSELDPLTVTATQTNAKEIELPAATHIFTNQDIKEMGAKTLLEVINTVPGFTMSRSPSGNGSPGFRGVKGYLTILINGIPLANEGYFQMGSFATSGIERVEVIRGGSAILYGADATGGVVNVITKKEGENTISGGAGNNGQWQLGTFLNKGGFSLSYDRFQEQERGVVYHHARSGVDYYGDEMERDNINLNYALNDNLNFMFLHSKRQSVSSKRISSTGAVAGNPWQNEQVYDIGQVSFIHDDFRAVVYGQNREWTCVDPSTKQRGRHYGVDLQNKWSFEKFALTAGGNFDYEKSSRIDKNDWVDNRRDRGAVFFLSETDLFSATKLLFGAREVLSSTSDNVFCPQLQIMQSLGESNNIYLNINKSVREPNLSQKYGYSDTQEPNENLAPEIGWTYEIGWKTLFNPFDIFKFTLFHMEIDDRIYMSRRPSRKNIYQNASEFRNTGAELSYRHDAVNGLIYSAGLYYGNPEQKPQNKNQWEKTGSQFGMNLTMGYRFIQSMVNFTVNHASKRAGDIGSIWDLGLNASHNLTKKDKIRFHVKNILDRDDIVNDQGGYFLGERSFMLSYERTF